MIFHRGGIFLSIDSTQSSTWSNLAQFPISAVHNSLCSRLSHFQVVLQEKMYFILYLVWNKTPKKSLTHFSIDVIFLST